MSNGVRKVRENFSRYTKPRQGSYSRTNGQVVLFEGFLKVYEESRDDVEQSDDENRPPQMSKGENIEKLSIDPEQHFTQPPPRYTEASLVKKMEELGIGRPSTYANIVRQFR